MRAEYVRAPTPLTTASGRRVPTANRRHPDATEGQAEGWGGNQTGRRSWSGHLVVKKTARNRSSKPGAPPSRGSSAIEDQSDAFFGLARHPGGRLKLKCLDKYRMGVEPEPRWFRMGSLSGGAFGLAACDAAEEDDDGDVPRPRPPSTCWSRRSTGSWTPSPPRAAGRHSGSPRPSARTGRAAPTSARWARCSNAATERVRKQPGSPGLPQRGLLCVSVTKVGPSRANP